MPAARAPRAVEAPLPPARPVDDQGFSRTAACIWSCDPPSEASPGAIATACTAASARAATAAGIDTDEGSAMRDEVLAKLDYILEVHHDEKPIKVTRFDSGLLADALA